MFRTHQKKDSLEQRVESMHITTEALTKLQRYGLLLRNLIGMDIEFPFFLLQDEEESSTVISDVFVPHYQGSLGGPVLTSSRVISPLYDDLILSVPKGSMVLGEGHSHGQYPVRLAGSASSFTDDQDYATFEMNVAAALSQHRRTHPEKEDSAFCYFNLIINRDFYTAGLSSLQKGADYYGEARIGGKGLDTAYVPHIRIQAIEETRGIVMDEAELLRQLGYLRHEGGMIKDLPSFPTTIAYDDLQENKEEGDTLSGIWSELRKARVLSCESMAGTGRLVGNIDQDETQNTSTQDTLAVYRKNETGEESPNTLKPGVSDTPSLREQLLDSYLEVVRLRKEAGEYDPGRRQPENVSESSTVEIGEGGGSTLEKTVEAVKEIERLRQETGPADKKTEERETPTYQRQQENPGEKPEYVNGTPGAVKIQSPETQAETYVTETPQEVHADRAFLSVPQLVSRYNALQGDRRARREIRNPTLVKMVEDERMASFFGEVKDGKIELKGYKDHGTINSDGSVCRLETWGNGCYRMVNTERL